MTTPRCIAFAGTELLAQGSPSHVAHAVRMRLDQDDHAPICVLDADTSAPIDFVLQGTPDEVAAMAEQQYAATDDQAPARRRGRPRLGVTAREITLLPRHWDWLAAQPGGASVTIRKLVDTARKASAGSDAIRVTQDSTHRFLYTVAGDYPGFEEVARALYAWDRTHLGELLSAWPEDIVAHAHRLLSACDQPE